MEQIYKKYCKYVYKYLYTLTHNHELSEELMQETFYSAIKNINSFRNDCQIYSWLCQIAKNKWKNYQIKNSKIKIIEYDQNIENWLTKDCTEDDSIEKIEIHNKIKNLDETSKKVINLRIFAGFSFKEIGQILNKSENWARVVFYRTKLNLRQNINKKNNRKKGETK